MWSLALVLSLVCCVVFIASSFLFLLERAYFFHKRRGVSPPPMAARYDVEGGVFSQRLLSMGLGMLLLLSLLASPLSISSISTLFSLSAPASVFFSFLFFLPFGLFFLLLEGSLVIRRAAASPSPSPSPSPPTPSPTPSPTSTSPVSSSSPSPPPCIFSNIFTRAFSTRVIFGNISIARFASVAFASGLFLGFLLDFLPSTSGIFFEQLSRLLLPMRGGLADGVNSGGNTLSFFGALASPSRLHPRLVVLLSSLCLLFVMSLPFLFLRPLRASLLLVVMLFPLSLFFYLLLCVFALQQAHFFSEFVGVSGIESIHSLWSWLSLEFSRAGIVEGIFSAINISGFAVIFRPAFGFVALCCALGDGYLSPSFFSRLRLGRAFASRYQFLRRYGMLWRLLLMLLMYFILISFLLLTMAPILTTRAWLFGGTGLSSLYAGFTGLYAGEGWLLTLSLALLSLSSLFGVIAFGLLILRVIGRELSRYALFMFLPLSLWGAFREHLLEFSFFEFVSTFFFFVGGFSQALSVLIFVCALSAIALRLFYGRFLRAAFFVIERRRVAVAAGE